MDTFCAEEIKISRSLNVRRSDARSSSSLPAGGGIHVGLAVLGLLVNTLDESTFHFSSPATLAGGCLPKPTVEGPGPKKRAGKQRADRQRIRPHFASQRFIVGRMPARSPSVKPPDAASPAASATM
jgi:hypothetical protein